MIVADESVPLPVILKLRDEGHNILSIAETTPGVPDEAVLERANQEQALLLTEDKDFGELVFRDHRAHHGVVLARRIRAFGRFLCFLAISGWSLSKITIFVHNLTAQERELVDFRY